MRSVKLIKYNELVASISAPTDLSFDSDRAICDFRAFLPVASVHASRVTNCNVLDVMLEVVEILHKDLVKQKNKIVSKPQTC